MTSFHPRSGVKDFEQNNSAEISKETLLTKQLVCTQRGKNFLKMQLKVQDFRKTSLKGFSASKAM